LRVADHIHNQLHPLQAWRRRLGRRPGATS
jgi:hypothetical protein